MTYDIIVVGGGHAGIEAAAASAKMGKKTLLITILCEQIGAASCNPAIGGLAKGHLVKEIDALGGMMGEITDRATISFRTLNESKGAAVRGSRAQIDMDLYRINARNMLLGLDNLTITQELAMELLAENGKAYGVKTQLATYKASKIIITTGTFLNGLIHVGKNKIDSGRVGEFASSHFSSSIAKTGLKMGRLKTGTCPRIDAKSIDFSVLDTQPSETHNFFSMKTKKHYNEMLPCYIAHTNAKTHQIILDNMHDAPLFSGQIQGVGPRYCPSIEDKINRFRDKSEHHIFVEPQTKDATEYYVNGLSTSLDFSIQHEIVKSIKGFENAKITRHGYAIEYDYVEPTELDYTLECKNVKNLYLAGQIIGTTGYEEAASLGLVAGINAVLSLDNKEPFIMRRNEGYIGVLIDDLISKGTKEPYRMFTSRAEYRLHLREQNAKYRMLKHSRRLNLLEDEYLKKLENDQKIIDEKMLMLIMEDLHPTKEFNEYLHSFNQESVSSKTSWQKIIAKKCFEKEHLQYIDELKGLNDDVLEELLNTCKYYHYIRLQDENIQKMNEMLETKIPQDINYRVISGLSNEVVEKLEKAKCPTLWEASKISGITPAALDMLHIYIKIHF